MQDYIDRLTRCGVSPNEAHLLCTTMVREFGLVELEELVESMEKEAYVAKV